MAKKVVVNKTTVPTTGATTHSTADSYVVANNGDLIVLDSTTNTVIQSYPKGTWVSATTGT